MNKLQQTLLPIKVEQSEERLTSLAGLMVVEELARRRDCGGEWMSCFRSRGAGMDIGRVPPRGMKPLVWMLQAGGRRLEDVRELRAESR